VEDDWQIPGHSRVAGIALVLLGSWFAFAAIKAERIVPLESSEIVQDVAIVAVMVIGGIGLAAGLRWAWFPAFLFALLLVGTGLVNAVTDSETRFTAPIILGAPGAVLMWSLLAPGTREWLLRRERAHPRPIDEPWVRRS
jgi:hypothetical protein